MRKCILSIKIDLKWTTYTTRYLYYFLGSSIDLVAGSSLVFNLCRKGFSMMFSLANHFGNKLIFDFCVSTNNLTKKKKIKEWIENSKLIFSMKYYLNTANLYKRNFLQDICAMVGQVREWGAPRKGFKLKWIL